MKIFHDKVYAGVIRENNPYRFSVSLETLEPLSPSSDLVALALSSFCNGEFLPELMARKLPIYISRQIICRYRHTGKKETSLALSFEAPSASPGENRAFFLNAARNR